MIRIRARIILTLEEGVKTRFAARYVGPRKGLGGVRFSNPLLPEFFEEVTIKDLKVGARSGDLNLPAS